MHIQLICVADDLATNRVTMAEISFAVQMITVENAFRVLAVE